MAKTARLFSLLALTALLTGLFLAPGAPTQAAPPADDIQSVTIAGTLQSELGCQGDWVPACARTFLTLDPRDGVWKGTFQVTPGNDEDKKGPRYKAALNGSWDLNYGKNAAQGGADIPLVVNKAGPVRFFFDPQSHWVTDSYNTPILVAVGDFQKQLGCPVDNDPNCMRAWLEDPEGSGSYAFVTRALKAGSYSFRLVSLGDGAGELTPAQPFTVSKDGDEIYFGYDSVKKQANLSTTGAPKGSLAKLKAVWVNRDTLLWNVVGSVKYKYSLFYSPEAALTLSADGIQGGEEIPLSFSPSGPGGDVFQRNPYLAGWSAFKISPADFERLTTALKSQLAVAVFNNQGKVVDVTGVQTAGALDALFPYAGPLGVTFEGAVPTLRVWAPTALSVRLLLFADAAAQDSQAVVMTPDLESGVWSAQGQADWKGRYYLYEVKVYVPSSGKIETNLVSDPYAHSLSMNSLRSQIVDLADTALKPTGWDGLQKPALAAPEDIVLYELHIRDFSIQDASVPAPMRGTYLAFTQANSDGMRHLAQLARAGVTHIHLLPAFDFASVDEDKSTWQSVDETSLASLPADSDRQAAAVSAIKSQDGFNWGYDPYHYSVPEGSYASDPNGAPRILEFRQMVAALNGTGLRVVMDVVYNHTSESGQNPKSVLDKIVPGYYYRLDGEGKVETSTCCQNTASEHAMMQKLMIDSLVTWAKEYKVDGFRFDLMGHHLLANMQAIRSALDALTPEKDGVDGKAIYLYGEGWDFGEVANNARGINASQQNIGGTGIGVFNDRLRDGARGGTPFSDPREQGFATGLFLAPNASEVRSLADQKSLLLDETDWIRLGLAGNLRGFLLERANGDSVAGEKILYKGQPAGYTLDPQENIVYVSAHDNETIFDAVQTKAGAEADLDARIRMNNLALSLVMFSQGVPFFHAGDDLLRSKSLDHNSYDSGDWFNRIDWSEQSDNWGVGLPIDSGDKTAIYQPLLANPALKPSTAQIQNAAAIFRELLQIRRSSPLFRLPSAAQIENDLTFLNTGIEQIPGLIVMRLEDQDGLDPNYAEVLVFFNANPGEITFSDASFSGKDYQLHPLQRESADPLSRQAAFSGGAFRIPGRTTSIFVQARPPALAASLTPTMTTVPIPTATPVVTATSPVTATSSPAPTATPGDERGHLPGWLAGVGVAALAALGGLVAFLRRRRKSR